MKHVSDLIEALTSRLGALGRKNAVVAPPISVGDRHVVPLCEISLGLAGLGGAGEGSPPDAPDGHGKGTGAGAGGGARTVPVAVLIVDGDTVRIEALNR